MPFVRRRRRCSNTAEEPDALSALANIVQKMVRSFVSHGMIISSNVLICW